MVISHSRCSKYSPLQIYFFKRRQENQTSNYGELLMKWTVTWLKLWQVVLCGKTGLHTTQATGSAFNLPTDRRWLWSCDLLAFCAAFVLPERPSELIGISFPHKYLNMLSRQAWSCRGCLICIWRYQILLSKSLPSQTSFEIWAQHHFNVMLLAFPEAFSRKVSYIKLAAVMFGLIDFFFLTWHQMSKRQFKKMKKGKKLEGKKIHPTAAFSTVHCSKHFQDLKL